MFILELFDNNRLSIKISGKVLSQRSKIFSNVTTNLLYFVHLDHDRQKSKNSRAELCCHPVATLMHCSSHFTILPCVLFLSLSCISSKIPFCWYCLYFYCENTSAFYPVEGSDRENVQCSKFSTLHMSWKKITKTNDLISSFI